MFKRLFVILTFFFTTVQTQAQQDEQLWFDFQLSYPFGGRFLLENTTTYQTLLSSEEKWRSISISPTFEWSVFTWLDLLGEVGIGYTLQKEGSNSWDIMPMVGGRFFVTQGRRIDTRFVVRYQLRYFRQIEDEDWDTSNRTRLRGEIFVCINGPNLFTDKLWYVLADYEEFIVLDQQLDERYANRRRARIGLGYRLSYKHRFELSYTLQTARNEIEGDFTSNDNVIQLRYKMFLNPAKRATNE
jgi:Protein of unknown function (DUF2490)